MSYSDMMAEHTVVSFILLRTSFRVKLPSDCSVYSNSSLWLVTFMYFGLNSINGAMLSRSSFLVMPLRGGTISNDGNVFLLSANISETFIMCRLCFVDILFFCHLSRVRLQVISSGDRESGARSPHSFLCAVHNCRTAPGL